MLLKLSLVNCFVERMASAKAVRPAGLMAQSKETAKAGDAAAATKVPMGKQLGKKPEPKPREPKKKDFLTKKIIDKGHKSENLYILDASLPNSLACLNATSSFEAHYRPHCTALVWVFGAFLLSPTFIGITKRARSSHATTAKLQPQHFPTAAVVALQLSEHWRETRSGEGRSGITREIMTKKRRAAVNPVLAAANPVLAVAWVFLATIVKRRPLQSKVILSALISFNPNFESQKGHASSIRYSLRTAFVGFLRCNHPLFTESRDKINKALRAIIPGESIDQIVRQVERMARTIYRVSHEIRSNKGEPPAIQELQTGNQIRNKISRLSGAALSEELPAKRIEFEVPLSMAHSTHMTSDLPDDNDDGNGDYSSNTSLANGDLSAAEKMIAMIGALLAEGERGAESLELLISNIHADLMADIVIETMKHLPKNLMAVSVWHNNAQLNEETPSSSISSQVVPTAAIVSAPTPLPAELASTAVGTNGVGIFSPDTSTVSNLAVEVRRDPRRDPRRLDPRRPGPVGSLHSAPLNSVNSSDAQTVPSQLSSKAVPTSETVIVEQSSMPLTYKTEVELSEIPDTQRTGKIQSLEASEVQDNAMAMEQTSDVHTPPNLTCEQTVEEQLAESTPSDATANDDVYNLPESDEFASPDINSMVPEEDFHNLIAHPSLLELKDEQRSNLHRLTVTRIIKDYKKFHVTGSSQPCLPLLARLVAHSGADDDILMFLEEHIVLDYPHHKGHELAMHVLYYLQAIVISKVDNCSSVATSYEKFLLGIAKALLDSFPATDKSFSKLLVEAPILPDSSLKLLEDLCHANYNEHHLEETRDGDHVTQGLVATWGLILGRPSYRQACLDIALKCALHPQEEVRAKAIRLVANKLYLLNYASDSIEQFAMQMLLSVVEQQNFEEDISTQNSNDQQTEDELICGPRPSEPASSESENNKDNQASVMKVPALSLSQAQQKTSLFFALCLKQKPILLQFVFDIYGKAPKVVKQSIHQHIPVIVKNLSTYSHLLKIFSDPPEGSKILIVLVLETLTEEATPSSELIATVKHLYETKLKDAVILIPMLSSFSKDEVLLHFFCITDACTACFEQRIVFTQHVLEKSLNHLVEQVPLPLLFMRTVIQAIDAFPSLVIVNVSSVVLLICFARHLES
ncbi:hypothetical protein ZIOFF_015525 [Zingiber officinale]|uniref:HEAT repeat-containing protein n=1 Tax=Zingiber officinale TaxID=94328 RepID=A0A8J5HEE3_ZINOF|nr:hypothetical protein ZIOFF_015525 [Zingiber officinale]